MIVARLAKKLRYSIKEYKRRKSLPNDKLSHNNQRYNSLLAAGIIFNFSATVAQVATISNKKIVAAVVVLNTLSIILVLIVHFFTRNWNISEKFVSVIRTKLEGPPEISYKWPKNLTQLKHIWEIDERVYKSENISFELFKI